MHEQLIHQTVRLKFRVNITAVPCLVALRGSDVVAGKKMPKRGSSGNFFIRQEEDDLTTDLFLFHGSRGALNDLSTTRNFGAEKVASKPPFKMPLSEGTFKASKLWRN